MQRRDHARDGAGLVVNCVKQFTLTPLSVSFFFFFLFFPVNRVLFRMPFFPHIVHMLSFPYIVFTGFCFTCRLSLIIGFVSHAIFPSYRVLFYMPSFPDIRFWFGLVLVLGSAVFPLSYTWLLTRVLVHAIFPFSYSILVLVVIFSIFPMSVPK